MRSSSNRGSIIRVISDPRHLAAQGAELLGGTLQRVVPVAGGDLSSVVAIDLDDGRTAIVKNGPSPKVEADMLRTIEASGAPVPAVLACDEDVLVVERLASGGRIDRAWPELGRALARLHGARGDHFGWHADYAFGPVAIENAWTGNWVEFWTQRRLLNQLPFVAADLGQRLERLARDLANRLPAHPAPALLHGDLWGGNVLVAKRAVTGLIDPACYYGDAEVDFAMLQLFNHPDDSLLEAYGKPASGLGERSPIYQLWPALVHLRLFGAGYRSLVERLLTSAGI